MTWIWTSTGTPNDSVNLAPATGAVLVFTLKQVLKQAGWVVKMSSDGTTYNATGDQITTGASGAGGMANTSAWFRIQDPAGLHEFTMQRGTTNVLWRVKWSDSAKLTGGSPAAAVTPTSTDQQIVIGGGTDASPTYTTWLGTDAAYRAHIGADNAAPYNFYVVTGTLVTGATDKHMWFVSMDTGTYPAADTAPYVFDVGTATATVANLSGVTANSACFGQGYYKKGLAGEAWTTFRAINYYTNSLGLNPYTGNDDVIDLLVGRVSGTDANAGRKGRVLSMMGWRFVTRTTFVDYFDTAGGVRYLYVADLAIVFPIGVVPSI